MMFKVIGCFLLISTILLQSCVGKTWLELAKETADETEKVFKSIKSTLSAISNQLMFQQFFTEERVRSEGCSGIKQIRVHSTGPKTYHSESYYGKSVAAIHNHANNIRTVGMGEVVSVINGIEFRTRHNDYRLFMASNSSKNYHAVQEVPFPDVPPEVENQPTIDKQIEEMRLWFKAWRDQNYSVRDYRKYFKPVLCYMEGSWTRSSGNIEEPFDSDRHFINAKKWHDLHKRIRYGSYTGSKDRLENLAFLPTKIMKLREDGTPEFAQWNYRILCHPLKDDVPLKKLRLVSEFGPMATSKINSEQLRFSRAARFRVDENLDKDKLSDRRDRGRTFLDSLMEQIPGKDNIGVLHDNGFDGNNPVLNVYDDKPLNVAKYHRMFKIGRRDAMGLQMVNRAFSDESLYFAMTTQDKVFEMEDKESCKWNRTIRKRVCHTQKKKFSWAVPLEIIYLTPLSKWNPHKLVYRGDARKEGKIASQGKDGRCSVPNKHFNGTNSKAYYITPMEFYAGGTVESDKADTSRGVVCVTGPDGKPKRVKGSGIYIFLPKIKGVGAMRQRYPILPIHSECHPTHKELDAVKDIVQNPDMQKFVSLGTDGLVEQNVKLSMGFSTKGTQHTHTLDLSAQDIVQLRGGQRLTITSSLEQGHQHTLDVYYSAKDKVYQYRTCDGIWRCGDGHPKSLTVSNGNDK